MPEVRRRGSVFRSSWCPGSLSKCTRRTHVRIYQELTPPPETIWCTSSFPFQSPSTQTGTGSCRIEQVPLPAIVAHVVPALANPRSCSIHMCVDGEPAQRATLEELTDKPTQHGWPSVHACDDSQDREDAELSADPTFRRDGKTTTWPLQAA